MQRALSRAWSFAFILAGCASAPPNAVPKSTAPTATVSAAASTAPTVSPACADAERVLADAETALDPERRKVVMPRERLVCVRAEIARAVAVCPSLAARADAIARADDERARLATGTTRMSADERWILQQDGEGHARVFERGAAGLRLALRLRVPAELDFGPDQRLLGIEEGTPRRLLVIDPSAGSVRRIVDVDSYAVLGTSLYVASPRVIRRYAWPPVAPLETVATPRAIDVGSGFRVAGSAVVVGDALVSLAKGVVLQQGLTFGATSADGTRIVACEEGERLKVIDTATGADVASFDTKKSAVCSWTRPTITPDGRFAVGVDEHDDQMGARFMVAVVYDLATKTVHRRVDLAQTFSTAMDATVLVEDGTRICVDHGNMHWRRVVCPWALTKNGAAPLPKSKVVATKSKTSSLPGKELARIVSVDGATLVVATAHRIPPEESDRFDRLQLHLVDTKSGTLRRSVDAFAGELVSPALGEDRAAVRLQFVDATHVLLDASEAATVLGVLDLSAGTFTRAKDDAVWLRGRFATSGGALLDLVANTSTSLVPAQAAWTAAPEIVPICTR